jgi:aminoglycoside phosphotransferase (APT) family kinase protein
MLQLTPQSAAPYLRERGLIAPQEAVDVRELSGGVSSTVLLIHPQGDKADFVVKQALPQLKVQQEWLCSPERIGREVETLEICGRLLANETAAGLRVPTLILADRANYCYAMTAAPQGHKTWKELLLGGSADPALAAACGTLLGTLHAGSWRNREIAQRLDDRQYFDALRLDPYYRRVAQVHPDLAPVLTALIDEAYSTRLSLVHGDFSPKNLLVASGEIWLIDFEVGHFGDPAFDLGFFLTHLALKAVHSGSRRDAYWQLIDLFWQTYQSRLAAVALPQEISELSRRTARHWSACLLARIDGKSPVDYLSQQERNLIRDASAQLLRHPADTVEAMQTCLRSNVPS